MKDADRPADTSLDNDRLEQLLDVPETAQPIVMIEYRNRGVPWWLLVTLVVVVPLVAVLVYQQVVVERYAAAASKAHYLAQVLETERTVAEKSGMESVPVEPAAASAAPAAASVVISAQAVPEPKAQPPASPVSPGSASEAKPKPEPAAPEGAGEPALAGAGDPPVSRVRSIFPIQPDGAANAADPKGVGAGSTGLAAETQDSTMFEEPIGAGPARPQPPGSVADSGPGESGPTDKGKKVPVAPDRAAGSVDATSRPQPVPPIEPLPTAEETHRQLAEESAKIGAERAEEQLALSDRMRVRRYEDRVRFHNELRQILATDLKNAGTEIDDLVRRDRGDFDQKTLAKARGIWRNGRLKLPVRVSQIRLLDIPESDILNFMSDNLYARMRAPGGPRDGNEVRVRAARLLLSCELSGATAGAAAGQEPANPPIGSRTGANSPR